MRSLPVFFFDDRHNVLALPELQPSARTVASSPLYVMDYKSCLAQRGFGVPPRRVGLGSFVPKGVIIINVTDGHDGVRVGADDAAATVLDVLRQRKDRA
jgi:hypothetical protein